MTENDNKLKKAYALYVASVRGDEQIRSLAKNKYDAFLIDNALDNADVLRFGDGQKGVSKKCIVLKDSKGIEHIFYKKTDVMKYYESLSSFDKFRLFTDMLMGKVKFN